MKLVNSATATCVPASRCSTMPIDDASIAQAWKPARRSVQSVLQRDRVGRREAGRRSMLPRCSRDGGSPIPSVPMTPQRRPTRAERLRDPPGGRGLAVRAGDGDDVEARARLAEEAARDVGRAAAFRPRSAATRGSRSRPSPRRPRPRRDTRRAAARARRRRSGGRRCATRPGDERVARAARWRLSLTQRAGAAQRRSQARAASRDSSRAIAAAHRRTEALLFGRHLARDDLRLARRGRAATPSMRSVCCTTSLNTGAATSPP